MAINLNTISSSWTLALGWMAILYFNGIFWVWPFLWGLLQRVFQETWGFSYIDWKPVSIDNTGDETRPIQAGRCYDFAGSRMDAWDVVDYQFLKDDSFTVSAWVNPDDNGSVRSIIAKQSAGNNWRHFYTFNGSLIILIWKNWDYIWVIGTVGVTLNKWSHVVWTYDWSSVYAWLKLYIDWVLQTTTNTWPGLTAAYTVNWPFQIGNRYDNATPYNWQIFWVGVWDVTLDATQALEVYNAKDYSTLSTFANLKGLYKCDEQDGVDSFDSSGNGNHWTIIGATLPVFHATDPLIPVSFQNNYGWTDGTWANGAVVGAFIPRSEANTTLDAAWNALEYTWRVKYHIDVVESSCGDFDGIDDYANTNYQLPFTDSDFSISAYINTSTMSGAIYNTLDDSSFAIKNWINIEVNWSWFIVFTLWDWTFTSATWSINVADWLDHHVTCIRDWLSGAWSLKIYVDGILDWSWDALSKDITIAQSAIIGAEYTWSHTSRVNEFNGKIWDVRSFSSVLTIPNIVDIMEWWTIGTETTMYVFSEWAWSIVYDLTWNWNDANLFNITIATFWGLQDTTHWNLTRWFSLYEHASLDDIWVWFDVSWSPLVITPETGYTKTSDNTSWYRHNNANTKLRQNTKIPALIYADEQLVVWDYWFDSWSSYDPIWKSYSDIIENVWSENIVMADESVTNMRKNLLTYEAPISWAWLTQTTTYLNH